LEKLLGRWRGEGDVVPLEAHSWQRLPQPGVYVLPGEYEQCHLRMGRGLPELSDLSDDYPESLLLDFGIGYLRVFYRTRSEGLSYGTGTRLTADADRGEFYVQGSTRSERAVELVRAVREEVAAVSQNPLDEGELETVRTFIIGTKIRGMETARDVVRLRLEDIAKGRPEGYTERLVAALQAATVEDLARTAERYVGFGDDSVLLLIGEPAGGAAALEELGMGPVRILTPETFGD
jgi:predicted Zn-dependent peptidase